MTHKEKMIAQLKEIDLDKVKKSRTKEMIVMRMDGKSLRDIGKEFGVSAEFVRQQIDTELNKEKILQERYKSYITKNPNANRKMSKKRILSDRSYVDMEKESGVSQYVIRQYELRQVKNMRYTTIVKLAEVYDLTFSEIIGEE